MDERIQQKFVKQLFSDENLQTKLSKCKTQEEAFNIVKAEGYDVEFAEFTDSMDRLNDIVKKVKQISDNKEELSESDLEMVAGGRSGEGWKAFGEMLLETVITAAASTATAAAAS